MNMHRAALLDMRESQKISGSLSSRKRVLCKFILSRSHLTSSLAFLRLHRARQLISSPQGHKKYKKSTRHQLTRPSAPLAIASSTCVCTLSSLLPDFKKTLHFCSFVHKSSICYFSASYPATANKIKHYSQYPPLELFSILAATFYTHSPLSVLILSKGLHICG